MINDVIKKTVSLCVILVMLFVVGCTNDLGETLPEEGDGNNVLVPVLPSDGDTGTDGTTGDNVGGDGAATDGTVIDNGSTDGAGTDGTVSGDGTMDDGTAVDGYPAPDAGVVDGGADGAVDAGSDGATDGAVDAGSDAGSDAGTADGGDGAVDAGSGDGVVAGGDDTADGNDAGAMDSGDAGSGDGTMDGGDAGAVDAGSGDNATDGSDSAAVDGNDTGTGEATSHIIQFGETVGTIAQRYGVSIQDIVVANNLPNANSITAGDTLQIVPGAAAASGESEVAAPQFDPENYFIHTVYYGETLGIIARRYGFTIQELADYNGIVNVNRVDLNQEIKIPIRQ